MTPELFIAKIIIKSGQFMASSKFYDPRWKTLASQAKPALQCSLVPRLHSPAFFYTVREKLGSKSWEVEPRNEAITMYLAALIYLRVYQGLYYVQNTILS